MSGRDPVEQLTAQTAALRDAEDDVRAVAEACSDYGNDEGPSSIRALYARFADRINALAAGRSTHADEEPW